MVNKSLKKMNESMKTHNCDLTIGDIFRNIWSTLLILRALKWVLAGKVSAVTCETNVTVGRIMVTL